MTITSRRWSLVLVGLAGCGASDAEIRAAQTSGYKADFAVVYSATLDAVRDTYPGLTEDATSGTIRTAWHPIKVSQETEDSTDQNLVAQNGMSPASQNTAGGSSLTQATGVREAYFVRFTVHVVGGRPWRVRVEGQASKWVAGEVPSPLRGAAVPPWLEARTESLEVAIYRRLKKYAVALQYKSSVDARRAATVDLSRYGAVPRPAAVVLASADEAAKLADAGKLRPLMADDFTWSFGSAPSADTAIATFQADPQTFVELARVIEQGCKADASAVRAVCPAAAEATGYVGFRLELAAVGGRWRLTAFVAGE